MDVIKFSDCPTYAEVKSLTNDQKVDFVFYLIHRICEIRAEKTRKKKLHTTGQENFEEGTHDNLLISLLRAKLNLTDEQLFQLLTTFKTTSNQKELRKRFSDWPIGYTVIQFEKHAKSNGMTEAMGTFLAAALDWPEFDKTNSYWGADLTKAHTKLTRLLHDASGSGAAPPFKFDSKDAVGDALNAALQTLPAAERDMMCRLLHHCMSANGGKPTKKFQTATKQVFSELKIPKAKAIIHEWLTQVVRTEPVTTTQTITYSGGEYTHDTVTFLSEKNAILFKGLAWSLGQFHDEATLGALALLAERSFKKIPGVGPTCAGVGNACLYSLANSKGLLGISQLSRLKLKITQANTRKLIEKYIEEGSAKRGITPSELEELAVPDFGLTLGKREDTFDDYTLVLTVPGVGKTQLQWIKPDGTPQKTAPAFIKQNKKHSDKLKKIKATAKQIQKYSTAQRDRIDRSYIEDRSWSYEAFQKYYLNHGLVSIVARKLIWILEIDGTSLSALHRDDRWEDIGGNQILDVSESTTVKLWHPILVSQDEVLQWRRRLEELQIQQPSKQAYREVYIVTDAEVNTQIYSNRMAAHLIKQHQFNALAGVRGWKYTLLGGFDHGMDGSKATIYLPTQKIRCEFWIEELYMENEMTDAGIWNYVSTDQVRFYDEADEVMNQLDVPKLVFTEMMRDVDLFVGVCSVGNDPAWQDGGREPAHRDYWTNFSFGSLNEVAKTRKAVLERLLPRLKIADKVRIDGKFVRVKGSLREYKIHIGSTNILMEPNDQYLCIVPARNVDKATDKLYLPFEGDRGLSLIVSKAVLLAKDHKITDTTILSQIKR